MEPIVIVAILGVVVLLLLFLGAPSKPIRLVSQGVVKLLIGALFLFFLNIMGNQFGIHIPINLVTSAVSGLLGLPGTAALVIIEMWII